MAEETNASSFSNTDTIDSASFLTRISGIWHNVAGYLLETISKRISHRTADYTILATESGKTFTNLGASGTIKITLPAAVVGLHFPFIIRTTATLQIDPNGSSDRLESTALPRVAGGAGKYISAGVIGARLHLICLETGKWAVWNSEGTWTVEA
ncbi:MAG: hypothetical protein V4662_17650 [Verrucomicrobiota bacterium]